MAIIPNNTQFVGDTTGIPIKQLRSAQINAMSEPFTMGDIIDTVAINVGDITEVVSTTPLTGGGAVGSVTIGIDQSSAVQDGYLSSTDWTTFNNKGDIIGSGTASKVTKWTAAGAIGNSLLNDNGTSVWNAGAGTGANNTAFGNNALISNGGGYNNTSIGVDSLRINTSGHDNVAIGHTTLRSNTSGNFNTALGNITLYSNTTGIDNTAIGHSALTSNTTGSQNVATGLFALRSNTTGIGNTANGFFSLYFNNGGYNTAVGNKALYNNTTAGSNVSMGYQSMYFNATGANNTAIGTNGLLSNTTGSNNSSLGYYTQSGNFSGSVILGSTAAATANNQFVVGSAVTNAGATGTATVAQSRYWDVVINGVAERILLA